MKTKHRVKSIVKVNSWIPLIGFLAAATIAQPASAARTFSIDPYGVNVTAPGSQPVGPFGGGISLPNAGTPTLSFGFVIPSDYVPDTPIKITLSWYTASTDCEFVLEPNYVSRTRPGHPFPTIIFPGDLTDGLAAKNGSNILSVTSTPNVGNKKVYLLTPGQGFDDQQPGDAFLVGFDRNSGSPSDTCTVPPLVIPGISIKYQNL
ncbi:MAG: hypothetical protein WC685_08055 [Methylobacter sp.]|jgi:hypothetical protein